MTDTSSSASRPGVSLARVAIVSAGVTAAAYLIAGAFTHWVDVTHRDSIHVSGSAHERITSDRAMWGATVHARGTTLTDAYAILARDVPRVRQFLLEHGIPEGDVRIGAVSTTELYAQDAEGNAIVSQIIGFTLEQRVELTSEDIERVGQVAREVTQLIEGGVDVSSSAPEYIHSGLEEIKIRLVGSATADARARAEQVAEHADGSLGRLLSANVGVVQVNAADQTEVSWEGVYDRSSVEKDVMVVVRTEFVLE